MKVCPACGRENPDDALFCSGCATALDEEPSPREERKIVTVVFADLVGSTAAAEGADVEDVRALLSSFHARLRAELERFGGTVEKYIGDAVMAVFGAPVAHEDDPERAVRAALAIRDAIVEGSSLEVRIAVNTGEALVSLGARPAEGEGMVAGDVVNTTARMQAAAAVNSVLVGETTYRATRDRIDYREHDSVEAKGKAEPVLVWEAMQARSRLDVDVQRPRAALVGRARELELLVGALARVREDRAPQLVTLVGAPGLGKSRLLYELFQAIEADPELIWWRQGRSLPYGEGVSYWALGEMVKTHAGILETDSPETAEAKLRQAVAGFEDSEWLERHLRPLAGLGGEAEAAADRRDESFAAWRRFFESLAEESPLVLVFEDLHWADDGLLDFVDHLVDWASGVPMLVACTARPELLDRRPGWGGGKRNATTVSLSPLSNDETARLISALLEQSVLPAETQARLLERAGGNPLYAEEFVRLLDERGEPERAVPETLQGMIAARLDVLPREEKALVQDASVVGKVFWLGALAAMDGDSHRVIEERLHTLERKEFVRRERRSSVEGDSEYAFLHALVREVAYGQIPRAERADTHVRVAAWIESLARPEDTAEMLAQHYLAALEYGRATGRDTGSIEELAAPALADAGDRALALNAFSAAERFYAAALDLGARDAERLRLIFQRARAAWSGQGAEHSTHATLEAARDELLAAGEAERAAEVTAMAAWTGWRMGRKERALELLEQAVALLEQAPPSRSKAYVLTERSRVLAIAEDPEGEAAARRALAMAEEVGAIDIQARALCNLGLARANGGDDGGLEDIERSIVLAKDAHSTVDIVRGNINLSSLTVLRGDLERSYEHLRAGLELAERFGHSAGIRWLRGDQTLLEYLFGRWDEAVRLCDEFLAEVEAGFPHYQEHGARAVRAVVRVSRGDFAGALADDALCLESARETADPQTLHPSLQWSAFVRLVAGRAAEAAELVDELLAASQPSSYVLGEGVFAAVAVGRAEGYLEFAARVPVPSPWVDAARAFASGDLTAAADLYAEIGALPSEAYARLCSGDERQVQRALAFYRSVRATRFISQGEALLAASA